MVFRAVVMETQAVPHIWIIRIRHILNITFNQKEVTIPQRQKLLTHFPPFSEKNMSLCVRKMKSMLHDTIFFYFLVFESLNWFFLFYIGVLCLIEMFSHTIFCLHTSSIAVHSQVITFLLKRKCRI